LVGVWCRGEAPTRKLLPPLKGGRGVDKNNKILLFLEVSLTNWRREIN